MLSLHEKKVLVVEDEYFMAKELQDYIISLGACVLGPVATVEQALLQANCADAAVLDINLGGRVVFPVADRLLERSVPIVFFTGYDRNVVPARMSHISVLSKPAKRSSVIEALMRVAPVEPSPSTDDIPSLLPKLRLAARLLIADENAADRLIEGVLEDAIDGIGARPSALSSEQWLIRLLQRRAADYGISLLH